MVTKSWLHGLNIGYNSAYSIAHGFLADRTIGRAFGTVCRLSSVVCDVLYSGKPRDAAMLISLSATLRENGWADLHEIFREGVA